MEQKSFPPNGSPTLADTVVAGARAALR
jgi:hypothetical protein